MNKNKNKSIRNSKRNSHRTASYSSNFAVSLISDVFRHGFSKKIFTVCLVLVCVLFSSFFLYIPFKNYYVCYRDNQKLHVQYEKLKQTNQNLEKEISYLQTEEGIKQRANESLGLVPQGDYAGIVNGNNNNELSKASSSSTASKQEYKHSKAPSTWYYDFLDKIFDYSQ